MCFVFSYLQFNEKGFLFNNAYIYASKQEREESKGKTALLIEGARRVGKSTIAEKFAKNEFNAQGKKLTRQGVAYILKKYTDACGIDKISPHHLRHTKTMHLTEANVNPIFIRDFLGHTDLKVTGIYSKTSVKMKREALDKMNEKDVVPQKTEKDWNDDTELMDWLNMPELAMRQKIM